MNAENERSFSLLLIVTALFCGALIMVIEVLGSRVIGPLFGVSLFVWTSLIAVTMIALAIGYAVGGYWSDRNGHPDVLYGLILAAGVLVATIPLMKGPVLKACMPFGLRVGAFASSLTLFGPPLLLLGCVSPYLIRIAAKTMVNIGRTVGSFYAISTIGSVLGTGLTGFVLISWLSVDQIFFLVSALLIGLSLLYFLFFRRRLILLPLAGILVFAWPGTPTVEKTMDNGTKVKLVAKKDGNYGNLKVVDYSFGSRHTRELIIDGLVQGGIDMNTGQSIYPYANIMGIVPRFIFPGGKRCLVIGLGAGMIPKYYEREGVITDVVDIDPAVARFARDYFDLKLQGSLIIEDARYYLQTTENTYDYIIVDVFNGDTTPAHVLSLEAFQLMRRALSANGVLAINFMGSLKQNNLITSSMLHTLRQVFPVVNLYPTFNPSEGDGMGNLAIFSYAGPEVQLPSDLFVGSMPHPFVAEVLYSFPRWKFNFPDDTPSILLTDEYNPIDCRDLWLKEKVRNDIVRTTDWDILIL